MKVFRKKLYMKDMHRTEEQCENTMWPVRCDGAQVSNSFMQDKDGHIFTANASWCEEVTSLDCQSDIDSMKDWPIGTEHVVRMNGKDVRVVVCSVHTSDMLDYKGCNDCALHGPCGGRVPCCAYERTNKDPVYFEHAKAQKSTDKAQRKMVFRKSIFCASEGISETTCSNTRTWPDECDGVECIDGEMVGRNGQHYVCNDEWCEEVAEHKPLVLKLFFSPEYNITFTEHNVNPDVGFETGKYYRFIGKESSMRLTLWSTMRKILEHNVLKCTNGSGRNANFEGIGDISNEIMYTWISKGSEKEEFKYWKEMRPFVVMQAPDIITFDELVSKIKGSGNVTGLFVARESKDKEKQKMKVDENFTFKKKYIFGTTLHEPKVVKTHKAYANDGACEACGLIISKGSFVLTANETDCNKVTKKTHRLCASCTAKYIKAKSDTDEKQSYIEGFKDFLKTNDIKVGTRVRITKDFGKDEDAGTYGHSGAVGKCGTVYYVGNKYINVRMDESTDLWWSVPYYAMEVISVTSGVSVEDYAQKQAEWVKQNNVKAGTKVRVTRTFIEDEDGSCCWKHDDLVGMTGTIDKYGIASHNLGVTMSDGNIRAIPYFVLEVVNEPTYEERQAEWVAKNNVKVGTNVRFTKGFKTAEDGSGCCEHRDAKGKEGFVSAIEDEFLLVCIPSDSWAVPFTAIELVPEEPWFKIGDKVRITIKSSEAYNKIGMVTNMHIHKDGTQTVYMTFEEFWTTKAFNADSKEKIGELYTPTYEERQAEWIKKHNLKEGDKIVILRTAKSGEDGWNNSWTETMNSRVGGVFTYVRTSGDGIRLSCGYNWPYFVLGVVKE